MVKMPKISMAPGSSAPANGETYMAALATGIALQRGLFGFVLPAVIALCALLLLWTHSAGKPGLRVLTYLMAFILSGLWLKLAAPL